MGFTSFFFLINIVTFIFLSKGVIMSCLRTVSLERDLDARVVKETALSEAIKGKPVRTHARDGLALMALVESVTCLGV